MAKVLGSCVYMYGMARASALRTICPFDIFYVALNFQGEEQQEYEELSDKLRHYWAQLKRVLLYPEKMNLTYQRKQLVCMAQARISCADELVRRLYPQDKILIF